MLTKEKILRCLDALNDELAAQNADGEILLTGGAAMCLVHAARDATKDVDALYEPKALINALTAKIAEAENLPPDWLNDGVKGFIGSNAPQEVFAERSNLRVMTVSAEYLLAMKLISARYGEKDYDDIRFLFKKLGVVTEEQAREIVTRYFPIDKILVKTRYVIEEIIEEQRAREPKLTTVAAMREKAAELAAVPRKKTARGNPEIE